MRALLIALLGGLLSSAAHAQTPACAPVPGVEALWAKPETRFVLFGELHGTSEIPSLFADVVCHASARRPIIVALEMAADRQMVFDNFLASDGSEQARAGLIFSGLWPRYPDGRGSQAMMDLVQRVRLLKAAGRDVRIVGFQPGGRPRSFHQNYSELGMAAALANAAYQRPDALILALVGNLHASKEAVSDEGLRPAAMLLPPLEVLALNFAPVGGRAWNCTSDGCGPRAVYGQDRQPRGVTLFGATRDGYDGVYSPGRPFTASPPAPSPEV